MLDLSAFRTQCPFYGEIPRDHNARVNWRLQIWEGAARDKRIQTALHQACSDDILFFLNAFVSTKDPRQTNEPIPMFTWGSQERCLLEICAAIGRYSLPIEKSRYQSATYNVLCAFLWHARFHCGYDFLCTSKKVELVDEPGEPDTLFARLDYMYSHLPAWLKIPVARSKLIFSFPQNDSHITGDTTTADSGRSGRRTAVFPDEYAFHPYASEFRSAVASNTNCVLPVSTHAGVNTEFYNWVNQPGVRKVRLHWTESPVCNKGMYTSEDGKLKLLDEYRGQARLQDRMYRFPEEYPFILDGKVRSPWYDNECIQLGNSKHQIARELDINPEGSASQFFDSDELNRVEAECVRPPVLRGEVVADFQGGEFLSFNAVSGGRLRLWVPIDAQGLLPKAPYGLAVDVSAGTGGSFSSNSVIAIGNLRTGEKVGEWVGNDLAPELLAGLTCAMGRWLKHENSAAKIIWEANGPVGQQFTARFLQFHYANMYYRENLQVPGSEPTAIPGWWTDDTKTKQPLLSEYRRAMVARDYAERSAETVSECRAYIWTPTRTVEHSAALSKEHPDETGRNHGDRVIASALLWWIMKRPKSKAQQDVEPPPNCFEARHRKYLQSRRDRVAALTRI